MTTSLWDWYIFKLSKWPPNLKLFSSVDTVWGSNQPDRPNQPIVPLELKFSGKSWEEKVQDMKDQMKIKKADVLVLSALDDVAWLLNLRGSDIQFNPVFFSYAAITNTRVYLFVNEIQVSTVGIPRE